MFEQINRHVSQNVTFSPEELDLFNRLLIPKTVAKKTFLLKEGEVCNFEAYIVKGCVRTYYIDDNGFEVILTFATESWWVSDMASFYGQKPSRMYIETMEETQILILNPYTKEELLAKAPHFERFFRLLVQRHLVSYQERLYGNIANTAQERYLEFLQKYPSIPQRVPQHLIASYLGMSPEFLSKIRSKLNKK